MRRLRAEDSQKSPRGSQLKIVSGRTRGPTITRATLHVHGLDFLRFKKPNMNRLKPIRTESERLEATTVSPLLTPSLFSSGVRVPSGLTRSNFPAPEDPPTVQAESQAHNPSFSSCQAWRANQGTGSEPELPFLSFRLTDLTSGKARNKMPSSRVDAQTSRLLSGHYTCRRPSCGLAG